LGAAMRRARDLGAARAAGRALAGDRVREVFPPDAARARLLPGLRFLLAFAITRFLKDA
jgi:hypothetical protein